MESLNKLLFVSVSILMSILVLFANSIVVCGQQKFPIDFYLDPNATAEIHSTIFLKPDSLGESILFIGTNKGKSIYAKINPEERLSVKPFYKSFEFPKINDSFIRDINFISSNKGYLLKSDGIFFSDGSSTKWKQITSNLDFKERQNATLELWAMSFVDNNQRVCVAGIYTTKTGNTKNIDKELLSCTNNITSPQPKWDEPPVVRLGVQMPVYLTSLYFDEKQNGWAVGIDSTDFKKGVIWHSTDGGKSWRDQNVEISSPILNVGGFGDSVFAVGFNGSVYGYGITIADTDSPQDINEGDKVEIQPRVLNKIMSLPGIGTLSKIIGKVKRKTDEGMLEIKVEEVLPRNIQNTVKEKVKDYFEDNPIAPKDVKKIDKNDDVRFSDFWQPIIVSTKQTLRNVKFADKDNGFIVGDKGTILYTKNGGISWDLITVPSQISTIDLYSIFIDKKYCWIGGSKGTLVRIKYK